MTERDYSQKDFTGQRSSDRIAFTLVNFDRFGEFLHERLHGVFYYLEEWDSRFMLITNLFDRDAHRIATRKKRKERDLELLRYCGTRTARRILGKKDPVHYVKRLNKAGKTFNRKQWDKDRAANWQALQDREMSNLTDTFKYFNRFRNKELEFKDIEVGTLKDYFSVLGDDKAKANEFVRNEYPIIQDYFKIDQDRFIGIPLLGLGLFQGIVWIIFEGKEEEIKFWENKRNLRRVIKTFQLEYDNCALDWDTAETNIKEPSRMKDVVANVEPTNPIQRDIKLKSYYDISEQYHLDRIRQSDHVVSEIKQQYIKTAIITILLDSYSHNISAHSLTTLSWWFRELSEYHKALESDETGRKDQLEELGLANNPLIGQARSDVRYSLPEELAPLFKFLLEKGAFWSGITRQTNFSGKSSSIYSILWYDFVRNPLYLGTIANTEQVRKLFINVTIYKSEEDLGELEVQNRKYIKQNDKGELLKGTLAIVNLQDYKKNLLRKDKDLSLFLERGEAYEPLKKELEELRAVFPGGIVGKHAFFTLLENEIRNVKHYRKEALEKIQREGLILNLSFHLRPVDSNENENGDDLLKVGVWLNHPVELSEEMLIKRIRGLDQDIITANYQPRLGGNHQDKICASMLLTGVFDRVQDRKSSLGEIYYPWIKTAAAFEAQEATDRVHEFELSRRRYDRLRKENRLSEILAPVNQPGYLKKYFHLWMGEDILDFDRDLPPEAAEKLENPTRYRFIFLDKKSEATERTLKSRGVIRVLRGETAPQTYNEAYHLWLKEWVKGNRDNKDTVIDFLEGQSVVARVWYTKDEVKFEALRTIRNVLLNPGYVRKYEGVQNRIFIAVAHGGGLSAEPDKFNYRSHGELVRRFGQGKVPKKVKEMPDELIYELIETLATRICIFDRRIYNRLAGSPEEATSLQKERLELYRKHLRLDIRNEEEEDWQVVRKDGFLKYHFVILHLSFMEQMKGADGESYHEERVLEFIDEQILPDGMTAEQVPNNFILVITTGRGRMAWSDKIKENKAYARFTTFRPIESILAAVEDALQMPDDFDLKYNLTQLLLGS